MAKRGKFRKWWAERDADARMVTGRSIRQLGGQAWKLWGKDLAKKALTPPGPATPDPLLEAYAVLGLSPLVSEKVLRKMYQFRVQEVHPDTGGSHEGFKKVDEAMDLICQARGIQK